MGGILEFDHGIVLGKCVGVLVVSDRPIRCLRRQEINDPIRAILRNHLPFTGEVFCIAVLPKIRPPDTGVHLIEIARKLSGRPRSLRVNYRNNGDIRKFSAVVISSDRRIAPRRNLVREDFRQRLTGQSKISD